MIDQVLERVEMVTESGCWIWMGPTDQDGYGMVRIPQTRRMARVHRVVYESRVGPIPPGKQLDHLCRVRPCCNPAHVRPVSVKENVLAAGSKSRTKVNADKTHCVRGHELKAENLVRYRTYGRICRLCRNENQSRRRSTPEGREKDRLACVEYRRRRLAKP